jgi:thioredoxin 1
MKHITSADFKSEVLDYKGVVLVDFFADWCGPCKMLGPILEDIDAANKEKDMKLVKLNVDENQNIAMIYNVMSIPTVMIFKDGKIVGQQVGVAPKDVYLNALKQAQEMKN